MRGNDGAVVADDVVRDINAMDMSGSNVSVSATFQFYPPAAASHEDVSADPQLFYRTLNQLYSDLGIKVSKFMKLGGQELNLHLLYKRVTSRGGAVQVIKEKQWRDVGDAFHLPKTITSVSFVLKRGYMQYLWDYEQVYFQGRGSQARLLAPVSRYTKDSGTPAATAALSCLPPGLSTGDANASAAVAVTPLSSYRLDNSCGACVSPTPVSAPGTGDPAAARATSNSSAADAGVMTLVGMPATHTALPDVGSTGSLQVTAVINPQSVSVCGTLNNVPVVGVLSNPLLPAQGVPPPSNSPVVNPPASTPDPSKSMRHHAVLSSATAEFIEVQENIIQENVANHEVGLDVISVMTERPSLPETIYSLLSKIALSGEHAWLGASTQLTPSGRCAAVWMELDAHKRSLLQNAVRADEERFRAEQALWDAQIVVEAARRRRFEATQAAKDTLWQSSAKGAAAAAAAGGQGRRGPGGATGRLPQHGEGRVAAAPDGGGRVQMSTSMVAQMPPADLSLASQPASPSTHVGAASINGERTPRTPGTFAVQFPAPMHAIHHGSFARQTPPSGHAFAHVPAAPPDDRFVAVVENPHKPPFDAGVYPPDLSQARPPLGALCVPEPAPDMHVQGQAPEDELMYAADISDGALEAWMPTGSWDGIDIREDSADS